MNIKKYRGATTREALEQIKEDLGENAFVIETKEIKTKGFLGFGSENQIEVSATVPPEQEVPKKKNLKLSDSSSAEPSFMPKKKKGKKAVDSMLSLSLDADPTFPQANSKLEKSAYSLKPKKDIETVEISSKAPKIVHPKVEATPFLRKPKRNLSKPRVLLQHRS